ncbi:MULTISPECIES: ribosome biogenesis GTPase Der [unclassified Mesorhizobium]|uniref:ribosome biogenesis GTPase Der n=5 Tax=Mesorhizobium TaxID=68287 RepID=UPI000BAFBF07|nr:MULTISPECIES: ribosome biogenesis GTPase Der [unclassified Mesorhizobium]PBB35144.1 ribosome biogenesis GTPase Der [Mesorhizobium sp. WSM3882]RUV01622.1 ribosome biogenesis GTPase Der [Mesorhizobium sp. M1A.F.Ca.IN.020.03.2.1]RUV86772.1 ribosome biogenesis GTPase Der [Mesorhizobium sp. M1A.F.Ca.IN.020.32.1.1]RUW12891.1 ribosome biogenesis GTPase Der [Mesorhizobium sp. M1A.F.Ca.IN.022.05.2.1]RWF93384.1 MAG: ribosome biogenesis GTPase Der [Mesorhizobium sp.]
MTFKVAIIGRPNVGKSTLFNRLVGKKLALVDDTPGVTRDRRVHAAKLYDLHFDVIDTAGFEDAAASTLPGRMRQQTEIAIREADLIFFTVDAKSGLMPDDRTFADVVRKSGKPVVLVANKAEARGAQGGMLEAWELGLGEPIPVSAEHGQGMPDLRDAVIAALGEERAFGEDAQQPGDEIAVSEVLIGEDIADPDAEPAYDETKPLRIAVVGRPNAGKSTLINALIGEERLLTGPEAGITRDSISVDWDWRGRRIKLFDTAGMRRKSKVQEKLEKLSVQDGLRAIRFAEIVIIVLDATIPFEKQDLQIADLIIREGRAPVIAFNKWDLIDNPQELLAELREKTERLLPQVRGIQAVTVSAETGRGLDRLMDAVIKTHKVWNSRVSTGKLNRWLEGILAHHPPPAVAGRRLKIKYVTQAKTRPPGFVVSCSRPDAMPQSYVRYLSNSLRDAFDMPGVPIRMALRTSENPFAGRAKKR